VFLSYASQDAEAAEKICEALRAAGIEVWFDQSELRGGDAWDQKIRQQIHDCALFIPVVDGDALSKAFGIASAKDRDEFNYTYLDPAIQSVFEALRSNGS
jgi:hypothetical protein